MDRHEPGRGLVEDALGRAVGVAPDDAAGRIRRRRRRRRRSGAPRGCPERVVVVRPERDPAARARRARGRRPSASGPTGRRPSRARRARRRGPRARACGRARPRASPSSSVGGRREVDLAERERRLGEMEVRVGQARDRDLVRFERDPPRERVRPGLELDLGAGEGDPAVADPDRLDPAEPGSPGQRRDPARDRGRRAASRSGAVGGVGRSGGVVGSGVGAAAPGGRLAVAGRCRGRATALRRRLVPGRPVRAERRRDRIDGVRVGRAVRLALAGSGPAQDDRRDARSRGSTTRDRDEHRGRPDEVGDRADDDDRQEARHRHEHVQDAEDAPADVLGQVLLELGLRRDRDERVGDARRAARSTTTTASSDVTPDRSRPPGPSARWRSRLIGPATPAAPSRSPSAIRPPSMTRRRGQVAAVRVEQQDAGHDAEPERQHDDHEVLGREPERLLGEVRAEDAEHADERGRDPEVDQRPADRAVARG